MATNSLARQINTPCLNDRLNQTQIWIEHTSTKIHPSSLEIVKDCYDFCLPEQPVIPPKKLILSGKKIQTKHPGMETKIRTEILDKQPAMNHAPNSIYHSKDYTTTWYRIPSDNNIFIFTNQTPPARSDYANAIGLHDSRRTTIDHEDSRTTTDPADANGQDDLRRTTHDDAVSYTHLTLPTKA